MKRYFASFISLMILVISGCKSNRSVSLCYDPNLEAKDYLELRALDIFDSTTKEVNEIFAWLRRNDLPAGSYSFCGVSCYAVCEIDGVPVCVAEVLSDNRTVSVIVPFNSNSGSIRKLNGSYFIDECKLDNDLPNCYNMPRLVEIISGLKSKSFEKRQAHNPVEGFN